MTEYKEDHEILWTCGGCGEEILLGDVRRTHDDLACCISCISKCHNCKKRFHVKDTTEHQGYFYCADCLKKQT